MHFLKNYYTQIIKQDFINKFKINNNRNTPKLKEITLNFGCKNTSIQKFAITMLALEIITQKKSTVTLSKKPNIMLKTQKNTPAGCKVELKGKEAQSFLNTLNLKIVPNLNYFSGFNVQKQQFNLFFKLPVNNLQLQEFNDQYPLFTNLPILDINMHISANNKKEMLFLAKSIKLPTPNTKK